MRLRMMAFPLVGFLATTAPEVIRGLGASHKSGKLNIREGARNGAMDAHAEVLNPLYTSANHGKPVLQV